MSEKRPIDLDAAARQAKYLKDCLDKIERFGWMVQGVFDPAGGPPFAYTVGLAGKGLPELLVYGLAMEQAHPLLNQMATEALEAEPWEPGPTERAFKGYPAWVLELLPEHRDNIGVAIALGRVMQWPEVTAYQVVWPDEHRRFPWQEGYVSSGTEQRVWGAIPAE